MKGSADEIFLKIDGLIGSAHDRILYTYMNQQGLEVVYSLLAEIHKYTKLATRQKRQEHAELLVRAFLIKPDPVVLRHLHLASDDDVAARFFQPLVDAVADGTGALDMWFSLDARLKHALDWTTFFQQDMFNDLCNAIRERHPLTLSDVVHDCNPARLRFLDLYMREFHPHGVGNLHFWVDVQSTFLPLVAQTATFSVALFEEIQVTVRRIFNAYLADNTTTPSATATAVADDTKKDVLARILLYQGEPFSSPRYATLFKAAQDQVFRWLATKIFPNFQNAMLYIQFMAELEWLATEPALAKAYAAHNHHHPPRPRGTLLFPLPPPPPPSTQGLAIDTRVRRTEYAAAFPAPPHVDLVACFAIATTTPDKAFACMAQHVPVTLRLDACWGIGDAHPDVKPFCLLRTPVAAATTVNHPPHNQVHGFTVYERDQEAPTFGLCFVHWTPLLSPPTPLLSSDETVYLPSYTCILSRHSLWPTLATLGPAVQKIHTLPRSELTATTWHDLVAPPSAAFPAALPAAHRAFLATPAALDDVDVAPLFRWLNIQNIISLLASLLVEHRVVLVSSTRQTLFSASDALLALLRPFHWAHVYLPFCPAIVAAQVAKQETPFFIGVEGSIQLKRTSDAATHRIRPCDPLLTKPHPFLSLGSSLCNLQKVHPIVKENALLYPSELIQHGRAVLVDLDFDEVYLPLKHEPPELPQTHVRALELACRRVLHPRIAHADQFVFAAATHALHGQDTSAGLKASVLVFLDALFGRATDYFRSFPNDIHLGRHKPAITLPNYDASTATGAATAAFGVFDIDAFLEANIELGCRDFFRQVFATHAFLDFLVRQRQRFQLVS
ncbi:Aste57867_19127 [Aphanomyces stellatus]|uniref:Aste57867_19127 protein n=1 Tax=Aphanomyces stellatus TaxID=120398 RepID=A0A485LCG5_9STRA|nr:hypothetical protein As57867_019063 [Aphanomyces stellatus]VFT95850.1 Aste57867_19127 [Aphanomyces stellatus]